MTTFSFESEGKNMCSSESQGDFCSSESWGDNIYAVQIHV